jgi:hypothetical protein
MTAVLWRESKDGDRLGLELYERHYAARRYRDGRARRLFVGPGEKLVLIGVDGQSLFAWRRFISMDDQIGVNCAVFRREAGPRASDLIREAMARAWDRWPGERLYTYVAPDRVTSINPGYCFIAAGWTPRGYTKGGHGRPRQRILDVYPSTELEAIA